MSDWFNDIADQGNVDAEGAEKLTDAEKRKRASMVNGGEAAMTPCNACGGSGSWRGRGVCFRCKGKGKLTRRQVGAQKAKATREENAQRWLTDHAAEIAYAQKRADRGSNFYASLVSKFGEWGKYTDRQLEIIQRDMAKDAVFYEQRKAEREAAKPVVDLTEIEALFKRAISNDIKHPVFRAEGVVISRASMSGRNAGALYVKSEGGTYLGKVQEGKFTGAYDTDKAGTFRALQTIAANPTEAAVKYGRLTGRCGCCGLQLVNPVSIRAGVGPVCADNWGLNMRREIAAEELAEEAEIEAARRAAGEII